MEALLLELLVCLERLGEAHGELYDSEAREQIGGIVMDGFVRRTPGFVMPDRLGMLSEAADLELRRALGSYIEDASKLADENGLFSFHDRLAAFQNPEVRTDSNIGVYYDDLFGYTPPEWYDKVGNTLVVEGQVFHEHQADPSESAGSGPPGDAEGVP